MKEIFAFVITKDSKTGLFITGFTDSKGRTFGSMAETEKDAIVQAANFLVNRELQLEKIGRANYESVSTANRQA